MINPSSIAHTRSRGNHLYPPFHLITIFAPPFLAGYQHRGMKEQWHKSNQLITTIVQGAQLLLQTVSLKGDSNNNAETTTYVNS
jgi:hypothetical protein